MGFVDSDNGTLKVVDPAVVVLARRKGGCAAASMT